VPRKRCASPWQAGAREQLLRPLFGVAAILLFGIPPLALALAALVQLPVLLFQHSNVRLPIATRELS
jgi:sterol desaturase/sphingolipid hydroxylase (fatty acid hydroxylase superfamily)